MFYCSSPACHFFLHILWLYLKLSILPAKPWLLLSWAILTLFSDSHDFNDPLLLTILPHASKLSLSHYSFHLSIDNSLVNISKSKLLCLIYKSITSPHPIYSIFFPTESKTHSLNQLGCYLNCRSNNTHPSTATIFPPPMTSPLLWSPYSKFYPLFKGKLNLN